MTLEDLLERIDRKKYSGVILERKDLSWDIIQKYADIDWPEWCFSQYAPLDYIIDHSAMLWDFSEISKRTDITIDFIKLYKDNLNWKFISENIDINDVINNPELPWNWKAILFNKKITPDDLIENPQIEWNYRLLSEYIDVNFVYANPQCEWDFTVLSKRVNIHFIIQNPDLPWAIYEMSSNPNLTIDYIMDNLDQEWSWQGIIENPNIALQDLIKHNLHMKDFKSFQRIYPDYCIENYPNQVLNWHIMGRKASLDIIDKYPALPWRDISMNENMTMDYVLKHPRDWNFVCLCYPNNITIQDILDNWDLPWHIGNVVYFKY